MAHSTSNTCSICTLRRAAVQCSLNNSQRRRDHQVPILALRYPEEIEERAAASTQKLSELKREKTAKERAERKARFDQYFQPFGYGL